MKMKMMVVALFLCMVQGVSWAAAPAAPKELEGGSPELLPGGSKAPLKLNDPSTNEPPEEIAARVKHWQELRFGMFIHWGAYSPLAGEWNGKPIPRNGEWIQYHANVPNDEYAKAAASFNPTKFNAEEWVRIAKDAGMKYMVITAKHHDGFCLFPSQYSDFTMQKVTPFKRDPIRELADACKKAGLGFGLYYSNDLDWYHNMWNSNGGEDLKKNNKYVEQYPGRAMGPNLAKQDPKKFDDYYRNVAMPQVRELLTNYGPLISLFFDGHPKASNVEQGLAMRSMIRKTQPTVVINNRLRSVRGDYFVYEQHLPIEADTQIWEGCMTMNGTWGYKKQDSDWKPTPQLIFTVVDAVSKGGNFLLNVGPTGEGVFPDQILTQLKEIGAWMNVNGEAIYGTQRSPFGAEYGANDPEKKDVHGKPVFNAKKDWRCTSKEGTLYIHLFTWPGEKLQLPAIKGKITGARLLAAPDKSLPVVQDDARVVITLPAAAPDPIASVIRLTLEK